MNLNGGGSAAVGEPGAGVVLPQVAGGEIHLCGDDAADDNGDDHFISQSRCIQPLSVIG